MSWFDRFLQLATQSKQVWQSSVKESKQRQQINASLSIDTPSLKKILPMVAFDRNTQLFINQQSVGFAFHIQTLSGANDQLVASLADAIKQTCQPGWVGQVLLIKHHYLDGLLTGAYQPLTQEDRLAGQFAQHTCAFHQRAAREGYATNHHMSARCCDYQVVCCFSSVQSRDQETVSQFQQAITTAITSSGLSCQLMQDDALLSLMRVITSPSKTGSQWPSVSAPAHDTLASVAVASNQSYHIEDDYIDCEQGDGNITRCVNLGLEKLPSHFALWQSADHLVNLLNPELAIPCPAIISLTFEVFDPEQSRTRTSAQASHWQKRNNAPMRLLVPDLDAIIHDWTRLSDEMNRGETTLVTTCFNVLLYTTPELMREHVAKTRQAFRANHIECEVARCTQWLRFLNTCPFMPSEGLWQTLQTLGQTRTQSHWQAVNFMPLVADSRGAKHGLCLPTFRHQCFFFDNFDDQHLPITNYNVCVSGSSGSGKSFFSQSMIVHALAMDTQVFVVDVGGSYKHVCHALQGHYIDAANLALNPFQLFESASGSAPVEQIRDLLCVMASPDKPISGIERDWLLQAVLAAKADESPSVELVIKTLRAMPVDQRLCDLITRLEKFAPGGLYEAAFSGNVNLPTGGGLVVLELGSLEQQPELATIVLFALILVIQRQFYLTSRQTRKLCVIDEAWRFLTVGNNPIAAQFIETGFRTARKHRGAFCVITQQLTDLEQSPQGRAILSCSDTQVVMRQGNLDTYLKQHPNTFTPREQQLLRGFQEAKKQGYSELMLKFNRSSSVHRLYADPFSRILFSSDGEDFQAVEHLISRGVSIVDAVQQVAQASIGAS